MKAYFASAPIVLAPATAAAEDGTKPRLRAVPAAEMVPAPLKEPAKPSEPPK